MPILWFSVQLPAEENSLPHGSLDIAFVLDAHEKISALLDEFLPYLGPHPHAGQGKWSDFKDSRDCLLKISGLCNRSETQHLNATDVLSAVIISCLGTSFGSTCEHKVDKYPCVFVL